MAYRRFPIPEFNHKAFRGLDWSQPDYVHEEDMKKELAEKDTFGIFPVKANHDILNRFAVQGEHTHALLCKVPPKSRLTGRSYSWWLQRAIIIDPISSKEPKIIADWRTPRPMNTRFGPENGITIDEKLLYVISCHGHGDHWVGNRTLVKELKSGYHLLGCAKDGTSNFHEFCLTFTWGE